MTTKIFLLDKNAIKQMKCSLCAKRKAVTIAELYWWEEGLVCLRCLNLIRNMYKQRSSNGEMYTKQDVLEMIE